MARPALRVLALRRWQAQPAVAGSTSVQPGCPTLKKKLEEAAWGFSVDLLGWFAVFNGLEEQGQVPACKEGDCASNNKTPRFWEFCVSCRAVITELLSLEPLCPDYV